MLPQVEREKKPVSSFDLELFLKTLPESPGCYLMQDAAQRVIYVGKAKNLKRRVSSYFQRDQDHPKTRAMVAQVAQVELMLTQTEAEAFILEYTLIKKHNPRYNIIFRDDKSYPYIYVSTQQAFPGLYFYRGARKKEGRVFGPFPSAPAVYETLHALSKIFPVRQCSDTVFRNRARPCLQYQIKRCTGPCVGLISESDYAQDVADTLAFLEGRSTEVVKQKEASMLAASEALAFERAAVLRDQIEMLKSVQARQFVASEQPEDADAVAVMRDAVSGQLVVQLLMVRGGNVWGSSSHSPRHAEDSEDALVLSAFLLQHYSGRDIPRRIFLDREPDDREGLEAWFVAQAGRKVMLVVPQRGQGVRWLAMAQENARQVLKTQALASEQGRRLLAALQSVFALPRLPVRMECFDISHLQGTDTVASQVVFIDGVAQNKLYRRYNITGVTPGDDPAAMYQAVRRRLLRGQQEGVLPDLLMVDGGRVQLKQAETVVAELELQGQLSLMAVAKGEGRKAGLETYYLSSSDEGLVLDGDDPVAHLLQRIRDEAHRFALKGQTTRRKVRALGSSLEDVPGVGAKTRQKLLRHFGGMAQLRGARVVELAAVPGVSARQAQAIFDFLHPQEGAQGD